MERISLNNILPDPAWAFKLPSPLALRKLILPLAFCDGALSIGVASPLDKITLDAVKKSVRCDVRELIVEKSELRDAIVRTYGEIRELTSAGADNTSDAIAVVDRLLRSASMRKASDLHLNPKRDSLEVRMRIDGILEPLTSLPAEFAPAITSRLKVMAGLDIAEKRAPQDGAFLWNPQSTGEARRSPPVDIRMATLPVRYGERITLRLLESNRDGLSLSSLGMADGDRELFRSILHKPHGMILLVGPTGSGKTTTLYAAIKELLSFHPLNILTVEDPVEYEIEAISQAEVDSSDKVSFGRALRSLLRHDPDVIMIGEIRDTESLDTAVKAALTGHLVLSTLHTNDAVGAIARLIDMGLAPHMLGATMRLVISQRLVRKLCPVCREASVITASEAEMLGDPALAGKTSYKPHGCLACAGRGYKGRTGLFELMNPGAELLSLIGKADEAELTAKLKSGGMRFIGDDARTKLLAGITDFNEIIRSIG